MSSEETFNKKEDFVMEAMFLLYRSDKVAIVDLVDGEFRSFRFREYVDGKAESLAGIVRRAVENVDFLGK